MHPAVCFGFLVSAICMAVVIQHPAYLLASVLAALCMDGNTPIFQKKLPEELF